MARTADSWLIYDRDPEGFAARYEARTFEELNQVWLDLLPAHPGRVLDVGSGSGRDAAALAARGWRVVAVEPSEGMRSAAAVRHPHPNIEWRGEHLPVLDGLAQAGPRFDLILLHSVWMHVAERDASSAMGVLSGLLQVGGDLVLTFKVAGPGPAQRAVPVEEIEALAEDQALDVIRVSDPTDDFQGRAEVRWRTVVLRRPLFT